MKQLMTTLILCLTVIHVQADQNSIKHFIGKFKGEAEISETEKNAAWRLLLSRLRDGFNVSWKTITQEVSGSGKSKSYSIDFVSSDRHGIYGSAMKTNLFGGQEALDPIKGEPFFGPGYE